MLRAEFLIRETFVPFVNAQGVVEVPRRIGVPQREAPMGVAKEIAHRIQPSLRRAAVARGNLAGQT